MREEEPDIQKCAQEIEDLRARLEEAEETLRAIRSGEVDALVIAGPDGNQIYTLKGAESTYRVLVEAMNEGALVLTADGDIMYSNSSFADMVDVPLEHVIGSRIHRFVRDRDMGTVNELLQEGQRVDTKRELALKNESRDEIVPTQISISNLSEVEAEGMAAVVTDLTEHKRTAVQLEKYREHLEELIVERTDQLQAAMDQLEIANKGLETSNSELLHEIEERNRAEEALRESEERFRTMLDSIPQLAWMANADGYIFWYNQRWYKYTGTTPQQMEGLGWQTVHDPEILPKVMERWTESILTGKPFDMEFPMRGSDGNYRWLLTRAVPVKDSEGRIVRWFGTCTDISEKRDALEALSAVSDRLKQQVHQLQRALIPSKPQVIEGYSVASAYIPAYVDTEIGGDFLDVFRTEDDKVGILIGDVSGKGIESAALAAITRSTVRAFAYDSSSPGDALSHANSLLSTHQVDYMQFVTAFLAILDPSTGDISYSSAGHPPAIVSHENGDTELLSTHNLPLGIEGGVLYSESNYTLRTCDRLVLYTDGITEARHDHLLFGTEGVESILSMYSKTNPDELVEEILDAVRDWAHGKLRDDTAVLVIRREM